MSVPAAASSTPQDRSKNFLFTFSKGANINATVRRLRSTFAGKAVKTLDAEQFYIEKRSLRTYAANAVCSWGFVIVRRLWASGLDKIFEQTPSPQTP